MCGEWKGKKEMGINRIKEIWLDEGKIGRRKVNFLKV
jgi:hypothetical protein